MKASMRTTAVSLLAASLSLALIACKPLDKETGQPLDGEGKAVSATAAGLKTEKQQASYIIGTQIGESLAGAGEEIDIDVVFRAIRARIDGKEPAFDEAQAMQIMQAFGERMQARQLAEAAELGQKNAAEGETFLAENGKKPGVVTTASGLQYEVLSEGEGAKPKAADTVRVHYKGTLLDGTVFDDSYGRGEPAQFVLQQVVPGWQEGLQLMSVGSKYRLWIPSALGYGEQGTPGGPIAPNSTLVFEVELLDVNPAK